MRPEKSKEPCLGIRQPRFQDGSSSFPLCDFGQIPSLSGPEDLYRAGPDSELTEGHGVDRALEQPQLMGCPRQPLPALGLSSCI